MIVAVQQNRESLFCSVMCNIQETNLDNNDMESRAISLEVANSMSMDLVLQVI